MNIESGILSAAVTLVIAVLNCFYGYRLKELWIGLSGFMVGALFGGNIAWKLSGSGWITALAALIVGLVVGAAAFRLYLAGIFILAFLMVFETGKILMQEEGVLLVLLPAVLGAAAGFLAMKFTKVVIILTTALGGGFSIMDSSMRILNVQHTGFTVLSTVVVGLTFAVIGAGVQFCVTAKGR